MRAGSLPIYSNVQQGKYLREPSNDSLLIEEGTIQPIAESANPDFLLATG
jgi:hypothetical protein